MNYALHRQTRLRVYATARDVARFGAYVCEECGVSVHFVRESTRYDGVFIPAHFNHESNSARARNCILFREGAERADSPPTRRPAIARGRPELMLRVVSRNHWILGLFLPRFEIDADALWLGDAAPSLVPIDLTPIGPEGNIIEVYPKVEDYRLELRKGKAPVRVESLSGLDSLALFAGSSGWGRRLGDDEMLAWGKSYVVVAAQLPERLLKQVSSRVLARHRDGKFNAALFALPPEGDAEITRVVANALGREINEDPVIGSVIAPLNARLLPSGVWLLPAGATACVVGFSFARPLAGPGAIVLRSADESTPDERVNYAAGTIRGCVRFSDLNVGRYEVLFDHPVGGRIQVEVPLEGDRPCQAPRPAVVFGVKDGDSTFQHTLWDIGLTDVLRRVETGERQLLDVRVPLGTTLRVEAVCREQNVRQSIFFDESEPGLSPERKERELATVLTRALDARGSVAIDGGGFGRVDFGSQPRTMLPREVSNRSRWLHLIRTSLGARSHCAGFDSGQMRRFQAHVRVEERV